MLSLKCARRPSQESLLISKYLWLVQTLNIPVVACIYQNPMRAPCCICARMDIHIWPCVVDPDLCNESCSLPCYVCVKQMSTPNRWSFTEIRSSATMTNTTIRYCLPTPALCPHFHIYMYIYIYYPVSQRLCTPQWLGTPLVICVTFVQILHEITKHKRIRLCPLVSIVKQ